MEAVHVREAYLRAIAAYAKIDCVSTKPPEEKYLRLNGLRLHYLEWGDANAPPLVLLHGGGQSAHTWDQLCLALVGRFHCLALDQRGHGDSEWSHESAYSIADHAADIDAFVNALGLARPIVTGMSMGGVNAIAYAAAHASSIGALICVDIGPEAQFEPVKRLMDGLGTYRVFTSPEHAAERLAALGARRDRALLRETLMLNLREQPDGTWTWKYDPRTMVGLTAERILDERRPLWGILHHITCPALVVRGGDSEIFSALDAQRFASALPHGQWVSVPRARHSVQTDNPRGLASAICHFADTLEA